MTDKQSTVVVSRELLEKATDNKYLEKERISIHRFEALFELRALLAATPEQAVDGGEPVAYADPQAFINFTAGVATHEWMWAFSDNGLVPLYRHAQPPAKVALPERHDLPHREEFESADQYAAAVGYAKQWNACLDEVAKLNTTQD